MCSLFLQKYQIGHNQGTFPNTFICNSTCQTFIKSLFYFKMFNLVYSCECIAKLPFFNFDESFMVAQNSETHQIGNNPFPRLFVTQQVRHS